MKKKTIWGDGERVRVEWECHSVIKACACRGLGGRRRGGRWDPVQHALGMTCTAIFCPLPRAVVHLCARCSVCTSVEVGFVCSPHWGHEDVCKRVFFLLCKVGSMVSGIHLHHVPRPAVSFEVALWLKVTFRLSVISDPSHRRKKGKRKTHLVCCRTVPRNCSFCVRLCLLTLQGCQKVIW